MGYTISELVGQLKELGVAETDTITVHTSLKSVGEIDGAGMRPAEALITALRKAVPEGLLLIPSHTFRNIREYPVYDVRNTLPCIGGVPSCAVELANAAYDRGDRTCIRSLHPDHSLVAFGKDAEEFVAGDALARSPMDPCGCYRKLAARGAKILLIGVDFSKNTFIHAVDEELHPDEVSAPYPVEVIDYLGNHVQREARSCRGPSRFYVGYEPYLAECGALTVGKLGDAKVLLCRADELRQVVIRHFDTVMKR